MHHQFLGILWNFEFYRRLANLLIQLVLPILLNICLSDFENDLQRRKVVVKIHTRRLGLESVNGTQLTRMALILLIRSGFWMMDYNNNGDFFVPRRWEREEFQVAELLQRRRFLIWEDLPQCYWGQTSIEDATSIYLSLNLDRN